METNQCQESEARHSPLGAVIGWVAASERLPEIGYKNQVLIYGQREYEVKKEVLQGWRDQYGFCSLSMREDEMLEVSHWMPLPEPPCL